MLVNPSGIVGLLRCGPAVHQIKDILTRQLIAETAWQLFSQRGFDRVTVATVAREAQVAEATVFNYFPTKEDLFYSGLEVYGARLVEAVDARTTGEPVLAAVRRYLLEAGGLLELIEHGDIEALERMRTVQRMIGESAALQAREQHVFARHTAALARLISDESGAPADHDVTAQVAANALIGVHRALVDLVRRRVLVDDRPEALAADVRELGIRAFRRLEQGLQDYGPKPADAAP